MIVKQSENNFVPCPAGTHAARCYAVIDLGTQTVTFNGKQKQQRKVRIGWELSGDKNADGKPYTIARTFTASLDDRGNLRGELEAWRGKPFTPEELENFDLSKLLGVQCMITVIHEPRKDGGKGVFDGVKSVTAMPKGMAAEPLVNPKVYLYLDKFDPAAFATLPDFLKKKILESPEGKAKAGHLPAPAAAPANGVTQAEADGEIPF